VRRRGATALSAGGESGRVALVATVLLAVATVATAWSGYQASRWSAETTKATMRGTAARVESTRASDLANAQAQIDVAVFTQWVDAYASGKKLLRDFYFERFRREFKPAVVAWIATRPLKNPNAPLTPFAMPQYRVSEAVKSAQLNAAAGVHADAAATTNQRADNYVLAVVLYASSLFFAGVSTKLHSLRQREILLAIGWIVFLGTTVWIVLSPVRVSV